MANETRVTMTFWKRLKPFDQYSAKRRMKTSHAIKQRIEATMGAIGQGVGTTAGDWLRTMKLGRVIDGSGYERRIKAEDMIARDEKLTATT